MTGRIQSTSGVEKILLRSSKRHGTNTSSPNGSSASRTPSVHLAGRTFVTGFVFVAITSGGRSGAHTLLSDTRPIIHIPPGIPADPDFRLAKYEIGSLGPSFSRGECTNTVFRTTSDGSCHADLFEELFKGVAMYPFVLLSANQVD
jgi:hypothetical protein